MSAVQGSLSCGVKYLRSWWEGSIWRVSSHTSQARPASGGTQDSLNRDAREMSALQSSWGHKVMHGSRKVIFWVT